MELLDFVTRPRLRVLRTLRPPAASGSKLAPYVGCPFLSPFQNNKVSIQAQQERALTIDRLTRLVFLI